MPEWFDVLIGVLVATVASSGFWAYMLNRHDKKDKKNKILLGLGHDRIMYLSVKYLERGDWITSDEYENLYNYLYEPYRDGGGNGAAERAVKEVQTKLRIVRFPPTEYLEKKELNNE